MATISSDLPDSVERHLATLSDNVDTAAKEAAVAAVVLPAAVLAEPQHPGIPPRVASWARELPERCTYSFDREPLIAVVRNNAGL
jgi:hypothetical protein